MIGEFIDEGLLNDMIGILIEFSSEGHFVTRILEAWCCADPGNKYEIKPIVIRMINKYKLDRKYVELLTTNPQAAQFSFEYLARWNGHPDSIKHDSAFYNLS